MDARGLRLADGASAQQGGPGYAKGFAGFPTEAAGSAKPASPRIAR
jgi:hypothetical protein